MRQNLDSTFGPAYDPAIDGAAVQNQIDYIRDWMLAVAQNDDRQRHREEGYRTLAEIAAALCVPESSVSADLRHLRKKRFGEYQVTKRRRRDARVWEYRVDPPSRLRFA